MKIKVLNDYKSPSNYENPIVLLKGDTVRLGEVTDSDGEYPDWINCTCDRTGVSGWVAVKALDMKDGTGTAIQDYTSKEMTVYKDDILEVEYELNGWYWCKRLSCDESGWVAVNNATIYD